jgi:hypothetical protein
MDVNVATNDNNWMSECELSSEIHKHTFLTHVFRLRLRLRLRINLVYRVHWLKAKARFNRWDEEYQLIPNEMVWTVKYFGHQALKWEERALSASSMFLPGHAAYAYRQKWM